MYLFLNPIAISSSPSLVAPDENQVSVIRRKAPPSDEDVRRLGNDLTTTLQSELDIPPVESATFLKQTKQTFERLEKEAMVRKASYFSSLTIYKGTGKIVREISAKIS